MKEEHAKIETEKTMLINKLDQVKDFIVKLKAEK